MTWLGLLTADAWRARSDMMPHERKAFEKSNPMLATGEVDENEDYDEDI